MANIHAVELGKARWAGLSKEERSAIASAGGNARWKGIGKDERSAIARKSWEKRPRKPKSVIEKKALTK